MFRVIIPSGMVTTLTHLFFRSSSIASAASPLICLRTLYLPGWMPWLRGFSSAASTKALTLLITSAVTRVSPISARVCPSSTSTTTSPVPVPS